MAKRNDYTREQAAREGLQPRREWLPRGTPVWVHDAGGAPVAGVITGHTQRQFHVRCGRNNYCTGISKLRLRDDGTRPSYQPEAERPAPAAKPLQVAQQQVYGAVHDQATARLGQHHNREQVIEVRLTQSLGTSSTSVAVLSLGAAADLAEQITRLRQGLPATCTHGYRITDPSKQTDLNWCGACRGWFEPALPRGL